MDGLCATFTGCGTQPFFIMGSISKEIKLTKLDRRYAHSYLFKYIVQFHGASADQAYHDALMWCYEQWGMTVDAETYSRLHHQHQRRWPLGDSKWDFRFSPDWAYLDKYSDHRIYLSEAAASWFRLSYLKTA